MNVRHFLVSRAARLFRVGAHVECVPESAPIPTAAPAAATATTQPAEAAESAAAAGDQQQETPQTTDFLLSIRCSRDGKIRQCSTQLYYFLGSPALPLRQKHGLLNRNAPCACLQW